MELDDPITDSLPAAERNAWLVCALRDQIAFTRRHVPYWSERLSKAGVDEQRIECLADLAQIPILTKAEFRAIKPVRLIPGESLTELKITRWTSGTTGQPTAGFWTDGDWAATVASAFRMLKRQAPMQQPVAFNAFSQGHVTGPLFNAALRRLGAVVYDRSHHPEALFSTFAQTELFDFDTLAIPETTARGKGIGLVNLLEHDPNYIARHKLRWWFGSSGTFGADTINRARDQGLEVVSNLYGSSEFAPFAISCTNRHGDYHLNQGHIFAEVVDPTGKPVGNGESGWIVVSHLRGLDENGQACTHQGTQILRLAAGDAATFLDEPCACGLTTPRLRDIRRIGSTDSKKGKERSH